MSTPQEEMWRRADERRRYDRYISGLKGCRLFQGCCFDARTVIEKNVRIGIDSVLLCFGIGLGFFLVLFFFFFSNMLYVLLSLTKNDIEFSCKGPESKRVLRVGRERRLGGRVQDVRNRKECDVVFEVEREGKKG